ncbi:hypothetical protein H072_628 [Dactylellina haptotyla CBS 200.50]|uniref:Fungal N-terminal domain-containing protein n=1 Tax=Dactylellina haptotyla (strain CBS 200.50) TaxID=1284197 RepID=S8CCK6_DACHA|nr:hypothetical protein H072_628 [Dactylellina haptotyla CBS 200.50]
MIEPVTLFSAIAGATNLAARLTIDLTRLTITLRNVPDQITQVCNEMVSLHATLNTLQQRFNPSASGYSEEQLLCLETVITSTKETLVQLSKLSDACEFTGKKKSGVTGIWKKMSWTLNESEIASYRSGLVGYTAMLNLMTATLADQRGANIEAMVGKTNDMLQTLIEQRNRLSIMPSEAQEKFVPPKTLHKTKSPKGRSRSSSVAGRDPESRKLGEFPQARSRSVAPSMSRRSSSNSAQANIPSNLRGNASHNGSVRSRANTTLRSASTSHLPLPTSNPPPLPSTAGRLHLDIPNSQHPPLNHGLPSPPPEYTEIAPGMFDETPPTPRSQRQIIRTARSPSTNPPSTRSASSRPAFRRAFSSGSAMTIECADVPPVPPMPALPIPTPRTISAKDAPEAHKLEFSGKWSVKEIRINDSFMGSGTLFLKKDDANKRVLVNVRLNSSKDTRLSYRWIESSSATRTKQSSMFGGPSYVLRSLVRADDYSGAFGGKVTLRLEDLDYIAGQRSFMIAINLIQQSPPEWLMDTKPREVPMNSPLSIEFHPSGSPPMGTVRNFFRAIRAPPSESNLSDSYPPTENTYQGYPPNNYSRLSPPQQYGMYTNMAMPPTPPRSPSESSLGTRSSRPSISGSFSTTGRSSYERTPPLPSRPPVGRDTSMRGAEHLRSGNTQSPASSEIQGAAQKRGRQRTRRGSTSWFSFGRN